MAERSTGLNEIERAAVKQRAAEVRAQEKAGKDRAAGEAANADAVANLSGTDQALAENFVRVVAAAAPHLVPKTYYGFAGFANDAGKIVVFFKPSSKFKERYATIGFEDRAALDDGDLWPVSFAVTAWTPAVESRVTALVVAAAR
jgi:uncharacterized protein YdhG (YjbR/CyaY superfamily)